MYDAANTRDQSMSDGNEVSGGRRSIKIVDVENVESNKKIKKKKGGMKFNHE